ncbi:hypothetical protein PHISP_01933 [Aspergillus sp. HF37]|nr:hypothetical protein PHISP_01933 [Aspergillus sp. HF37]
MISSKIMNVDYATLLEWIRIERMKKMPAEGSSYDKALVSAMLFVERLHSFDIAIEQFAGGSQTAAQLAYVHCASLLELGEENASALMSLFGLFYRCSMGLGNLLNTAELFFVSPDVKDQLVLALADLVTLVVGVATHFHKSLLTSESVSVDIYRTFRWSINGFHYHCEQVSQQIWRHQLLRDGFEGDKAVSEIENIKHWLEPEDPVLASIINTIGSLPQERQESTCLWIASRLARFLRGDQHTLAISGKPGSGKSTLAGVINDHLQHAMAGKSYNPIFVPIDGRIPASTAPQAVARAILSQLFNKGIGNLKLYEILADAYDRAQKATDEDAYDSIVWAALGPAIKASASGARELVLVIDGLDVASCGESAMLKKLKDNASNVANVKLIVSCAEQQTESKSQATVHITRDLIFDDIAAVVRRDLQQRHFIHDMSEEQREASVTRIAEVSNGSFLWATIAMKSVKDDDSLQALASTGIPNVAGVGNTITDLASHSLQSKITDAGKEMLVWLATASRPLTQQELSTLVNIQLPRGTVAKQDFNVHEALMPVESLVCFQNNLVYLRHGYMRDVILNVFSQVKTMPVVTNRNSILAQKLLLYAKECVVSDHEPSLAPLEQHLARNMLEENPLLDFALRYWAKHTEIAFDCTTEEGVLEAGKVLKNVLPTRTTVPLLEMTVWRTKPTPLLRSLHDTQTRIYQQSLTTTHPASLQTALCQALFYRGIQGSLPSQASRVFYDTAKISNAVLSVESQITMQMTKFFLDATADQVTDSRTDIMINRAEMLQLLVECSKFHYGVTSSIVTSTLTQLSEHYYSIQEEIKAQEVLKFLKFLQETTAETPSKSQQTNGSLLVRLRGSRETSAGTAFSLDEMEELDSIPRPYYDSDFLLNEAQKYFSLGKIEEAERTYVELWQHTSRERRLHRSTASELRNINAVLEFSRFLENQNHERELVSVLLAVWEEHGQPSSTSEAVVSELMTLAKFMRSVGLTDLALSVLEHCEQNCDRQSTIHGEIQRRIQSIFDDAIQLASKSMDAVTESIIRKIVVSTSTINQHSIAATDALVEMYMSQHRWLDATEAIERVLQVTWPEFFPFSLQDVTFPLANVGFYVELVERLGNCYRFRRLPSREEDVRFCLYRASRRSRPADDELLERVTTGLLQLYERTAQMDKAIAIHQEILSSYTKHFGEEHPMVVKKLWTLAELTRPRPISLDYYRQIVHIVNRDSEVCHPDALGPLLTIATELLSQGRYNYALEPCRILFNTLQHLETRTKLQDQVSAQNIYERYAHCLRAVQSDIAVIHDVTVQYRNTCVDLFGPTAAITIQATKILTNICNGSRQYQDEAIRLYEELLGTRSDEVYIDHEDIRAMLDSIYEDKADSTGFDQMHDVIVIGRHLRSLQSTYGWAHEKTLRQMEQMASQYVKQGDYQSAISLLRDTMVQVLSKETSSAKLMSTARSIATSYIAFGQVDRARELSQEIYSQIISKDATNVTSVGFDFTSVQRQGLAFLAQLEYSVRSDLSVTLNEILSSFTTEYLHFEQCRAEMNSKTSSFRSVLDTASRLNGFLLTRGYTLAAARFHDQLTNCFLAKEGSRVDVDSGQAKVFISTILEHFSMYSSENFLRTIAIASYRRVSKLLGVGDYQSACDLALTSFKYIWAHDDDSSLSNVKLAFKLGLTISGRDIKPRPESSARKNMLSTSGTIMRSVLDSFKKSNVDLTGLDLVNLNNLIGVLYGQKDYHNLAWVLTSLWDRRETHGALQQQRNYTLALGRMLVITRYLIGDYMAAVQLAEDIVYNCARVQGPHHADTVEMTVLLSQMYTSVAHGYQNQKDSRNLAYRYYKKAASLHEEALRDFISPSSVTPAEMNDEASSSSSEAGESVSDEGEYVRQHLHLLRLIVERLGDWPKAYTEYEQLNSNLFKKFSDDLKGIAGMPEWNLRGFESAGADELITPKFAEEASRFAIAV